ncbi:AraC family transcriptional regulator [Methyloceanibacter sp.]|uniref:helix-turn-helix transcriptional regulator n=1 Tax=Methyloceanibacter sp. TaxID=1965321 RepID=UPI002CB0745C|nr:AraC family transcriptional regulator [Methyloceanibacter sp.]HML92978.1 AraC family transcriptional regulator [Methyloceanibacter sp.]
MQVFAVAEMTLIDFASEIDSPLVSVQSRVSYSGLIVSRCQIPLNPGARIATAQLSVFVHESAPVELTCRDCGRRYRVGAGQFHLSAADYPVDVSWTAKKQGLVVALEDSFVERAVEEAFAGKVPQVRSRAALRDPAIEALTACLRYKMSGAGRCSRLCFEYVGASVAIRLLEAYGDGIRIRSIKGGLSGYRQRRVMEFIDAHLNENMGLTTLAAEAGLSAHHFGKAFKASFGLPPCQYVTRRRIQRAKELLLLDHQSISAIAHAVGFCSHSHLSDVFRKLTGMTPTEFRKTRGL